MRKIVKIVFLFIGLVLVVFFATGILFDQTTYTTSVEINKPVNEVFAKFTDVNLLTKWTPNLKTVTVLKETPNKVGTVYEKEIENKGRTLTATQEIKGYEPNKKITYFLDANITLKTDTYVFTVQNGKTTIVDNAVVESNTYLMDCIYPWMKSTFKKMDQTALDNFKAMLEK